MRRRFALVLVALLVGSVGILVAYSATWVVAQVPVFAGEESAGSPGREIALTGRDLVPLGAAMGWVGLAAIAALLATRTWGRRVTGAVVLAAGGVAGVTGVAFAFTEVASGGGGAFVEAALGSRTDAVPTAVSVSAWWALAILSGLTVTACGLLALVEGPTWSRLSSRYSRTQAVGAASAAATWDALDRGEDPTLGDDRADPTSPHPGSMEADEPSHEDAS